jgi:hypothetical protein
MRLPTEDEINVHNSLDEITASRHFLNKTLDQAEELFRENSAYYQEDLMWMGPRAFSFYLQAAINYLKSEFAVGDDHLVSCLYDTILFRSDQEGFEVALDNVKDMIGYIMENFQKFNVDTHIYGDLLSKYTALNSQLFSRQTNS